jgi:hypothetical protein
MPWFGGARKEPHWIIKRYGIEVQLDRVRQFRRKRVDDKQQNAGTSTAWLVKPRDPGPFGTGFSGCASTGVISSA